MGADEGLKSGLFSHPFVYIEDHINRCLELCDFFLTKDLPLLSDEILRAVYLSIILHDFGKTTSYFQEYINSVMKGTEFKKPKFNHSPISGIYAFSVAKKLLASEFLPFFVYITCRRHHSNLKNFKDEATIDDSRFIKFLKKQAESIDEDKVNLYFSNLRISEELKSAIKFSKEDFLRELESITRELRKFRKILRKRKSSIKDYLVFQYIFSLLLDSDKTEAGAKPFNPQRYKNISCSVVENYKVKHLKQNSEISSLRERAYKEVMEKEIDLSQKVYSLTLPTGMGKTLTGFAFALKLREIIHRERGRLPRIIYSLPFLSIIDQNAEVLKGVLETEFQVKSSLLLKHHHLLTKTTVNMNFQFQGYSPRAGTQK